MMSLPIRLCIRILKATFHRLLQLFSDLLLLQQLQAQFQPRHNAPEAESLLNSLPPGSWDSHMHVTDPANYPLTKDALYTPKPHLLPEALAFEASIGIQNIVLVQPSIYGTDNTCMLNALRTLGPRHGRAVVTFDPETITSATLRDWHKLGVRGVRVNTQSVGRHMSDEELVTTLHRYADIIRPLDWVLQLYVPLATATVLEKVVPELGVRVCLDHFGAPDPRDLFLYSNSSGGGGGPYSLPGFASLVNLLRVGNTYIKLSAPYRMSGDGMLRDLEPVAKEILRVAGMDRAVFASDWPHTRFEGLDIRPFMETLLDWCGRDQVLIERVFRANAETLWGV